VKEFTETGIGIDKTTGRNSVVVSPELGIFRIVIVKGFPGAIALTFRKSRVILAFNGLTPDVMYPTRT
jgi:hypothetical protein